MTGLSQSPDFLRSHDANQKSTQVSSYVSQIVPGNQHIVTVSVVSLRNPPRSNMHGRKRPFTEKNGDIRRSYTVSVYGVKR